jgi:hypothetical protein
MQYLLPFRSAKECYRITKIYKETLGRSSNLLYKIGGIGPPHKLRSNLADTTFLTLKALFFYI